MTKAVAGLLACWALPIFPLTGSRSCSASSRTSGFRIPLGQSVHHDDERSPE